VTGLLQDQSRQSHPRQPAVIAHPALRPVRLRA
jgi:hypothetical protein